MKPNKHKSKLSKRVRRMAAKREFDGRYLVVVLNADPSPACCVDLAKRQFHTFLSSPVRLRARQVRTHFKRNRAIQRRGMVFWVEEAVEMPDATYKAMIQRMRKARIPVAAMQTEPQEKHWLDRRRDN